MMGSGKTSVGKELAKKLNLDFIDIDLQTYNLSVIELEKKLIQAKQNNKLPKIVIPVHFAGQSCNMKKIHALGEEYGFKIIEDASHAIGGPRREAEDGLAPRDIDGGDRAVVLGDVEWGRNAALGQRALEGGHGLRRQVG